MGYIIAVAGKGGTGKTTTAALIIRSLVERKIGSVLAIDADPNSTLADTLGIKVNDTVSGLCEDMLDKKDDLPAGMTKDRYLEYRTHQALVETKGVDLLVMGRPEGPGCYCYANNLLREIVKKFTDEYKYIVMDNEAGMEHISRKTARKIDLLLVVSDYSRVGVRSAAKVYGLTQEMKIKLGRSMLVVNKAKSGNDKLEEEIKNTGLEFAGFMPFSEEIERMSLDGKSIKEISSDSAPAKKINEILDAVLPLALKT